MKTNIHTNPVSDFTSVNVDERKNLKISAGDTVRVWVKINEVSKGQERVRLQAFEGLVLSTKHGNEPGATFTVRKVSSGVGVERIFPLFSPNIDKIEIVKRAKVRRAKLYHIREKVARQIKRQMRRASFVNISTLSDIEEQDRIAKEAAAAAKAAEEAEAKAAEEAAQQAAAETVEEKVEAEDTMAAKAAQANATEEAKAEAAEIAEEVTESPQETNTSDEEKKQEAAEENNDPAPEGEKKND